MLDKLALAIAEDCQLVENRPILVGVSGGPDSLCLMDAMHRLRYPLVVAHFNHGLRPEAVEDAQAVQAFARERDLPFVLEKVAVAEKAGREGLSIEEASREARYRFLFDQAQQLQAQAVAVGHTADDQVETVLMHLLRGAALSGLRGISPRALPNAWSDAIPLVRPLIDFWRSEVLAYCLEWNLQPVYDRTNLDTTFFRNRLRHELIPYLEKYNPAIRQVIRRTARVLQGDYEILEALVQNTWEGCVLESGPGYVGYELQAIKAQPPGLQRRLLRRGIGMLRPALRDIDFESIERALAFLRGPSQSGRIDLIAGLRLTIESDKLWVATWEADLPSGDWPQVPDGARLYLPVPGALELPGGWQITASPVEMSAQLFERAKTNPDPYRAWVDADRLETPLLVRGRLPGDRFQPLGTAAYSVKLSDLMINEKLPRRARSRWPLVCSGAQIIWLPGFRLAHPFRLSADTRRAFHLQLRLTFLSPG